ncbi:small-conductance mechanosensitive channel [Pontibacter aydingkolensis]|uniref:Mechanosensitive ion channel family protein n=1 Tax=Pontibacter aydingkolensis TaxID=1911536 RepID=A0ABS7CVN8_9BACT|nr:mechanosensitive ion channel domain-containing protein [Pontibacter aydingkolensis]MBW7467939.1 mechanosensitive ion channel family protein [Pontibacter aydingkolensis]
MNKISEFIYQLDDFALGLGIILLALVTGIVLKLILFKLLSIYNKQENPLLVRSLTKHLNQPLSFLIPLLFLSISIPLLPYSDKTIYILKRVIEVLDILVFAWALIKLTNVGRDIVRQKYQIDKADNYRERKLFTQLQFIRKITILLVAFIALSMILLSFDAVRKLGTGLLTSAGVVGIVVGIAAQKSIANLLAGLQIAFTQPIRLDDVLVVENEFGRVEEITLTYVVLRLWDNRRLILPLNYFIDQPFQNWTRTGSDILATVYLYTDYTIPIEALRKEFDVILAGTELWNKQVAVLQVTDSKERTLELRALMSANNSGAAWDLRCLVREKLVQFIQQNYPESLPKLRTEFTNPALHTLPKHP